MINFDTQTINHTEGESESLQMNENNLMQNEEHQGVKNYASSSEDEEDHTEKKDQEKDHSSSSSSDSEEDEATKKDNTKKKIERRSSSSSSSEDEEKEQNDSDMEALIDNKESSEMLIKEASNDMQKDLLNKHNIHEQPSSSDEDNEINDDDKDMGSEKDLISYSAMQKAGDEESSEDEQEKEKYDEKKSVPEIMEFTPREYPDTPSANKETEKEVETDTDKNIAENANCNDLEICTSAAVATSMENQKKESDECFEQSEIIQDNASSILGDVCSMIDMHSDEV